MIIMNNQDQVALFLFVCWISLYFILTDDLQNEFTYPLKASPFMNLCNRQEIMEIFKIGTDNQDS